MEKQVKVVKSKDVEPEKPITEKGAGSRVRRLITKRREGSDNIMLGVSIGDPFQEEISWSYPDTDEVYFMVSGEKTLFWEDPKGKKGEVRIVAGDAVYLPAGFKYRSTNQGSIPYFLI
jgi:mannose-6-phosphate isomerase-like protein (cupin superfamily)